MDGGVLTFEEKNHIYRVDGVVYPSVTQIIEPLTSGLDRVSPDILERARLFGEAAHATVEYHVKGILDEERLDPHLAGILRAFRRFLADKRYRVTDFVSERPLASKLLGYAGRADLVADARAVIDIKTRPFHGAPDPVQVAAYKRLHLENGGSQGNYELRVLSLYEDGTYTYYNAERPQAWEMFRMLLDYRRMGAQIEAWRKQS